MCRMNAWLKIILKRWFVLSTIVPITFFHGSSTYLTVQRISPEEYSRYASDLSVTAKWRYGYIVPHHGAHLVKAPTPETVPHLDRGSSGDSDDKEIFSAMSHELDTYPLKAALEALLYSFLVGYALLALWLRDKFAAKSSGYSRRILFEGAIWALGWTLACLPLLCFGYGSSLFSTWEGPGALSYSGPYPGIITMIPGETISYRPLLETASAISMISKIAVEATGLGRFLPDVTISQFVWIWGVLFYCPAAFLVCGASCLFDAVVAKRSDRQK
jgi:hypothetical protein